MHGSCMIKVFHKIILMSGSDHTTMERDKFIGGREFQILKKKINKFTYNAFGKSRLGFGTAGFRQSEILK